MVEQLADHLGLGERGAGSRVLSKDSDVEDCFAHRGAGIRLEGTIMGGTEQNQARWAWEKACDAKQESEDQLRMMIDGIPTLAWACRPDGTTEFLNQRWHDYTGLSIAQALGWGWQVPIHPEDLGTLMETWSHLLASGEPGERVFHPDDVERLHDERQEALARGTPFANEQRARRHDGQYRWFLIQYNPLRDDQGRLLRWYATGTDIDERKQAEERMRTENLALREDIDRASMFEEIVGPGNIRELQNVVERAVILCESDTFAVEERWLKRDAPPRSGPAVPLVAARAEHERALIEAALSERHGRVSGPAGAAAKLGLPRQTLESKIKTLGIHLQRFKT
jgi:PAS domain-containing protein